MLVCPLCRLTLSDNETTCPRDGHEGVEARPSDVPAAVRARFTIVEPYAQGASGDLYVADDTQTGRRGVLKLLRLPEGVTPAEKARLKREIVKQATLGAGVLSAPLATGDADGRPWIFREWHDGVSLAVKLARGGALAMPEALSVAAEIAAALDVLHRSGLLHRDLKPGHVIVEPQPSGVPRVSVIDAGIAGRVDTSSVFAVMGTPEYLSPEQATGKLVSFRSDLYALGCVLFEMLTGAPPFTGGTEELLAAHAERPAPTPQMELPAGVSTLLSQLLAKEPRERPFSAQQVKRALEPFLPEDASSKRESTQTFEKLTERRVAPVTGSGTLRPPRSTKRTTAGMPAQKSVPPPPPRSAKKGASVPPPPPPKAARAAAEEPRRDPTMELSPLDLETAEAELAPKPRKPRVAKTLMGVAPPTGDAAPRENPTMELSPLDLEDADDALAKPPAVKKTMLGMPAAPASVPPPPPKSASSAGGVAAPAGATTEPGLGAGVPSAAAPSSPGAEAAPSSSGGSPAPSAKPMATLGSLTGDPPSANRSPAAFAPTEAGAEPTSAPAPGRDRSAAAFAPTAAIPQMSAADVAATPAATPAPTAGGLAPSVGTPAPGATAPAGSFATPSVGTPAPGATAPAGSFAAPPAGAAAPTAGSPTPMGTTSPGFADAPVPATGTPPWQSQSLHPSEAPPPMAADEDEGGLDYDDLAETVAFDREKHEAEEAAAAAAMQASAATASTPGAPSPFPTTPAPTSAVREAEPVKVPGMRSTLPIVALVAVVGICGLSVVGGGFAFYVLSGGDDGGETVASNTAPPTTPEAVPTPPPTPVPPPQPAVVQPTPTVQPEEVAEPAVEEPAVEEPPAEEPVEEPAEETAAAEPAEEPREERAQRQPREERQPSERPEPRRRPQQQQAESGATRLERFNALREEALGHFRARRFAQAATAYEGATRLNPRHAGSFAGLGASRMALGQHGPAIQAYQRAAQLQPRHPGFQAALGRAYQMSGDRGRARQAYQRALSIDPNNRAAQQGLASLGG